MKNEAKGRSEPENSDGDVHPLREDRRYEVEEEREGDEEGNEAVGEGEVGAGEEGEESEGKGARTREAG